MKRQLFRGTAFVVLGTIALLASARAAEAQRPSLEAQEQRDDATEAAICAYADAVAPPTGLGATPTPHSYRPVFCTPSCGYSFTTVELGQACTPAP